MHVCPPNDPSNRAARKTSVVIPLVLLCSIALGLAGFSSSPALGSQTRDQCERCCKSKETDDFYLEQCRLKCFRTPDHCKAATAEERATPPKPAPAPERKPAATPRPASRTAFQYPNPLRLVPGKEWEAAGLILTLNGIPQQHPKHQEAMRSMVAVLTDFVKRNPQGGSLPTAALEAIVKKYKK